MSRIDLIWIAVEPVDVRNGMVRLVVRVMAVFGASQPPLKGWGSRCFGGRFMDASRQSMTVVEGVTDTHRGRRTAFLHADAVSRRSFR